MARQDGKREILEAIASLGGLRPDVATRVGDQTGVAAAEVYATASFYELLANPDIEVRVCQGLSCRLRGSAELLDEARRQGLAAAGSSCLAGCDVAPAAMRSRRLLGLVTADDLARAHGITSELRSAWGAADGIPVGHVGPAGGDPTTRALNLSDPPRFDGAQLARAVDLGADGVIAAIDAAGLQGRGGAGFPAAVKWRAVRQQPRTPRHVVLNGDEGEPGTFKDREVLARRPDLVVEGLAIAARTVGAETVTCYLRDAFEAHARGLQTAIDRFATDGHLDGIAFHLHRGHGAYICGEETAMLEAIEGRRGLPRIKPPFPTEQGLFGLPTLIHNVETIACVPAIVARGGAWFRDLGRTGPGTKLYCVSGDVRSPGVYELPLGVCLDELVECAGGYDGELHAFSPGGASSGFLPASERRRPLDFKSLAEAGSMLGSAGVVVLNSGRDLRAALLCQLSFFEAESCGQCAPCRIGTRFLRERVETTEPGPGLAEALEQAAEVAWEMNEGSICGLGQAAPLPLTTLLRHFPEAFA